MDIEGIINNLSQQEKAALCSGRDFWHLKGIERFNIPAVMITDGPHGLRKEIGAVSARPSARAHHDHLNGPSSSAGTVAKMSFRSIRLCAPSLSIPFPVPG